MKRQACGFTLIELLLAMTPALLRTAFPTLKLKAAAQDLVQEMHYVRNAAVVSEEATAIRLALQQGEYLSDLINGGQLRSLPAGLSPSRRLRTAGRRQPSDRCDKPATGEGEPGKVPPCVPIPFNSLREITERALFSEGRTPPEKTVQESTKVPSRPLWLKLEGVAITPQSKVAIITDRATKELLRLSQGMSHPGWKVSEVSEESVTLEQGIRTRHASADTKAGER